MSRRASKQQKDLPRMSVVDKTPALSNTLDPELDTARLALSAAPKNNAMGEWPPALSLNSTKLTDWIPIPRPREDSAQPESLPKSASAAHQYPPIPSTLAHSHQTPTNTPQRQPTHAPSVLIDLPTQIAQFEFSYLTAHTTLRRLSPKTRVIVTCQNTLLAYKDMAHLARIWRRAVAGLPCAAIVKILDPLSRLSEMHARKLCMDMRQGLQAYELWGERVKAVRECGEGSMRAAWWDKFDTDVRELEAVVDIDDLQAQFKAVGVKHLEPAPVVKTRGPVAAKARATKQRLAVAANTPAAVIKTPHMAASPTPVPEQPYSNDDFLYPRTPPKVPRRRRASAPGSLSKSQTAFECFIAGDPTVQAYVAGGDVDGNALRVVNRLGRRNQQRRMPLPDEWCGADMI
jgi:hypothetical protein